MTAPTLSNADWLKELPAELLSHDEVPLLGNSLAFPYAEFASLISKTFTLGSAELHAAEPQWRAAEDLFEGMTDDLIPFEFTLSPLQGSLWWIIGRQQLYLAASLLLKQPYEASASLDPAFFTTFYQFLAAECAYFFAQLPFANGLSINFFETHSLPKNTALSRDITLEADGVTLHGRLIISEEFRRSWKEHQAPRSLETPSAITKAGAVSFSLEAGRVEISLKEWQSLELGDILVLDSCTVQPENDSGTVRLTYEESVFFLAKIKDGSLKILENPTYVEDASLMGKNFDEDQLFDDSTSEDTFDEDTSEELTHDDSSMDLSEEEHTESEHTETEHTEEEELEEELEAPVDEKALFGDLIEEMAPEKDEAAAKAAQAKPTKIEDVPLTIVLEVGRLKMPIQQIANLQPGNLIEANIHPVNGIDLVLNGRRIAKGELVRLGEILGVRILDMA